ncbi:hypothetical protein PVAND_005122 [Polypedilum vanderplanki]|uniref:Fatty acid desaturase domain-containing protein n=1 Tax=Polypedilum vanderplanki TaxID=319348 RepID=A0A9J6C143_POLVA|nr:hypothetical protein PVAND_005122 [Polypedilum vanderplanki]
MKNLKFFFEEWQDSFKNLNKQLSTIIWPNFFLALNVHLGGCIGLYYLLTGAAKSYTHLWVFYMFMVGGTGLGPGSHRFFSHRSYKATRGFKIYLLFCHTLAGQYSVIFWCRVHRTHHKFTDTEKDPTNIKKGFWYSHIFCLFTMPFEARKAMDTIDVSDLFADKDVVFQYKYIYILNPLICILFPTIIPYLGWNESFWISFFANEFRWFLNYNQMSFANSFMHLYGAKPYDRTISAGENILSIIFTFGEGYHNFHHIFPWDYRAGEVGDLKHFNISTVLLDICAWLGFVYDRKRVTQEMIDRRKARTGDGTDYLSAKIENPLWGFGDVDMDIDDRMDLHAFSYDNNNEIKCD